jgi:phenylalanyl-tRNA synthetase beta chain
MGTHDMASVQTPFTYTALLPEEFSFTPLKSDVEIKGYELEKHFKTLKDNTMLKYLSMITVNDKWPVLLDSAKKVMSVDPVINSRYSEIKVTTKNVLIECSSSDSEELCKQVCCELIAKTAKLLGKTEANPLAIEPLNVCSRNGHLRFRFPTEEDIAPYFAPKPEKVEKKGKKK